MDLRFCGVHFVRIVLYRPDELDATLFPPIEPNLGHSYNAAFCGLTLGNGEFYMSHLVPKSVTELYLTCACCTRNVSLWSGLISVVFPWPQNSWKAIEIEYLLWWSYDYRTWFFSWPRTSCCSVREWLNAFYSSCKFSWLCSLTLLAQHYAYQRPPLEIVLNQFHPRSFVTTCFTVVLAQHYTYQRPPLEIILNHFHPRCFVKPVSLIFLCIIFPLLRLSNWRFPFVFNDSTSWSVIEPITTSGI